MASSAASPGDSTDAASPPPGLACDLIMRGGVTSGVVYPGALAALAQHYRFCNIGGASAGAIAAGLAAAAEYGRQHGNANAFAQVDAIPAALGGAGPHGTTMRTLFRAAPALAGLESLLWRVLGGTHPVLALLPTLWGALALAGLTLLGVGMLGLWVAAGSTSLPLALGSGVLAFVLALIVLGLAGVARLSALHRRLRDNGWGLATGRNAALAADASVASLLTEGGFADWMHATIQSLAGKPLDAPLAVADLWGNADPAVRGRNIDLILTTTNVSQQLAQQFPFLERSSSFLYFCPDDLAKVLPPTVVAALGHASSATFDLVRDGVTYRRLPAPANLPILLGIRMSLSFPLLISAVKLYETRAFSPKSPADRDKAAAQLQPCWFSDGGITSNFPVESFDTLLPGRPTFCIDLADLPPDPARQDDLSRPADRRRRIELVGAPNAAVDAGQDIAIAVDNRVNIRARHLSELAGAGAAGFLLKLFETARNSRQNELATLPGQRDRIVRIFLDPGSEGGLNLDMAPATIANLALLGRDAGTLLLDAFGRDAASVAASAAWRNHRWVRLRTTLAGVEALAHRFDGGWKAASSGPSYPDMIAASAQRQAPSYPWGDAARIAAAVDLAGKIAAAASHVTQLAPAWPSETVLNGAATSTGRSDGAPRPPMALRFQAVTRDPLQG
ncbi:hypothetical protein IP88_03785 [alpha proteobacterium AAP81b]|nr:hypothetical protein IP88_03785 [alpha proteobacterium AAP81b]